MAKSNTPQDLSIISPEFTAAYARACEAGRAHAAQFAQALKDKPYYAGAGQLAHLAARIDYTDESASKGFSVGFYSHLERLIALGAQHLDIAADLTHINVTYAATAISD
ncbi:MAG: hypothetical protein JWP44_4379 [Mucilaginibacter sp.]|nr:hypothetical protein [Mucilaginibacter sp.]